LEIFKIYIVIIFTASWKKEKT